MNRDPILEERFGDLVELCKKYRVEKLYTFGSIGTDRFDPDSSDIDLIVELEEMPPIEKGETLLALWNELEDLFQREIDLLSDQPIQNPFFRKEIESTKKLLYDRQSEEISV